MKKSTLSMRSGTARTSAALAFVLAVSTAPSVTTHTTSPDAAAQAPSRSTAAQPTVPGTCTPVSAQLSANNEQLPSGTEAAAPDTARIQSALNQCAGRGKAVELTATEYANIGVYNSNITASRTDVKVSQISGSGSVPTCSFPAYPAL